jgi:long-chain acyl-CoA synthetase
MPHSPANLGDLIGPSREPGKTALVAIAPDGAERSSTYAELADSVGRLARQLAQRDFRRGARIALCGVNSAEYLIAYLAIMRAGLVAVPVNTRLPKPDIAFILADAAAEFAFADDGLLGLLPSGLPALPFGDLPLGDGPPLPPVAPRPHEVAMILYTSGSTGRPKGVLLSHSGQLWALRTRLSVLPAAESERSLVAAPLYHMNGLFAAKMAFLSHATLILLPNFTPASYIAAIDRHRPTTINALPTMLARILKEEALLAATDRGSVRRVLMGSAPSTQALWDKARLAFPGARIATGYGTTEHGPANFGPHPDGLPTPDLSPGYPLPGTEFRLVGGDSDGEGVLEARCPAVMKGYANLPEATAQVLHDGWYNTGDVFRRDENGFYFFVGRNDDMFVTSGENIWPGEVERVIERHPAVHQASVVPLPDEERGQIPVAFAVLRPGMTAGDDDIKQFVLFHLPPVKHPRHVFFRDELPLTATTKIDKKRLAAEAAEALGRR